MWHVMTLPYVFVMGPMSPTLQGISGNHCHSGVSLLHILFHDEWIWLDETFYLTSASDISFSVVIWKLCIARLCQGLFTIKRVLSEIEKMVDMNPDKLPEESRFLLEMDFDSLYNSSFERQSYWVRAMKAARHAGKRAARCNGLSLYSKATSHSPFDKDGRTGEANSWWLQFATTSQSTPPTSFQFRNCSC